MFLWSFCSDLVLAVHNLTKGDHKALSCLVLLHFRGCICNTYILPATITWLYIRPKD